MRKNLFTKILAAAVVVGIAAIPVLSSCRNKDGGSNNITTSVSDRFAIWDNFNNQFVSYFLNYEKFDSIVNNQMGYGNDYRFVLESVSITDSMPRNINVRPEVKYVILDSELECSHTFWLMGDFMTKRMDGPYTYYGFNDSVVSGNYCFDYFSLDTVFRVTFMRDEIIKTPLPRNNTVWQPRWTISCKAKNCIPVNNAVACGKKNIADHVWDCDYNCDFTIPNATCQRDVSWFLSLFKVTVSASS